MTRFQLFSRTMQWVAVACTLLQLAIDASDDNIFSTLLILSSTLLIYQYLERSEATIDCPISSLAIIGFNVTSAMAALVAQTMSWLPVTHLLRAPVLTFSVLGGVAALAVGVHWVYRHLAATVALRDWLALRAFRPLGLLDAPPVATLWAMAMLGSVSTLQGGAAFGDAGGKLLQATGFLQWLPFAIPLYHRRHGDCYCDLKKQIPLLIAFTLFLMGIGLMRNARQLMLIGPVQAGLIYFLWAMQDRGAVTRRTIAKGVAALGVLALGIALFTDVAVAMVVARDKRETSTPWQMAQETFALLSDRQKLANYRLGVELAARTDLYDEAYLSNPILARFSETKFQDNMVYFAVNFDETQRAKVLEATVNKVILILPQPVLDVLKIDLDKQRESFSMGDYYRYQREGPNVLGGFATGSIWADLISLGGNFAPFLTAMLLLVVFICFDSLSLRGVPFLISPVVLGTTWSILLYGLGGESLAAKLGFLLRDMPQKLAIYAALVLVLGMVFRRRPEQA